MTPEELRAWRDRLKWSQSAAAKALGMALRSYKYMEAGTTSIGNPRPVVPRYIELATYELTRRALSVG